jgi:hypothetical protein
MFDVQWQGWNSRYSESLRAGRSWKRIPVKARFSAPVQTVPGAHPASYTVGTGSFAEGGGGVKRIGRGVGRTPSSSGEVKERVELYLYSPSGPSWPVVWWTFCLITTGNLYGSHLVVVCSANELYKNKFADQYQHI